MPEARLPALDGAWTRVWRGQPDKGSCWTCLDMGFTDDEVLEPDWTPPVREPPLPWRWETMSDETDWELRDADGVPLLSATNSGTLSAPSAFVRAVTERAGAMEALLRKHQWAHISADGSPRPCCPECREPLRYRVAFTDCHAKGCALGVLLAEIDAAKAGGPVPAQTPYSRVLRDPKMSNPDVPHAFKPNGLMRGCRCGRDEDDPIHTFYPSDEERFVADIARLRDLVSVAPRGSTPEHYTAVLTDGGRGFSASGEVPEGEDEQVTVDRLMDDVVAQALAARKAGK